MPGTSRPLLTCLRDVPQVRAPHCLNWFARPRRGFQLRSPMLSPRRFSRAENIKTQSKVKSSEQRGIRAAILDQCHRVSKGPSRHLTSRDSLRPRASPAAAPDCRSLTRRYPALEPHIEDLLPKKGDTIVCKCKDYIQLILDPEGEFMFFQCRNGPFIPTLRLLHKCVAAFVLRARLRATSLTRANPSPAGERRRTWLGLVAASYPKPKQGRAHRSHPEAGSRTSCPSSKWTAARSASSCRAPTSWRRG